MADVRLLHRLLAELEDVLLHLLLRLLDDLLDPRRVDAAVLDELGQGEPGGLAADVVEGADDDDAGRVVDDHIDAGGLLEGADVAALAADDPALHVVAGDVDRADGGVGGVLGGVALDGGGEDLAGLRPRPAAFSCSSCFWMRDGDLVGQLAFEPFEQQLLGLARATGR